MAFSVIGSLVPYGGPVIRHELITASITLKVMDSVKNPTGYLALGTTGAAVFGHVMGIHNKLGVGEQSTGVAGASFGSFVGSFLTPASNETVAMHRGEVDISQNTLYSASNDSPTTHTTGYNLAGYRVDLASEVTLDENTFATSTAQYGTWGLDPNNTVQQVVNILESSVFNT